MHSGGFVEANLAHSKRVTALENAAYSLLSELANQIQKKRIKPSPQLEALMANLKQQLDSL